MKGRLLFGLLLALASSFALAQWRQLPGLGTDIGVGPRGQVWAVGVERVDGGFSIQRCTGRDWQRMPGGAVAISAGQDVWLVNEQGGIFRQQGRSTGGGY